MSYISINAHIIRRNAKNGTSDPPIRIARSKTDKHPRYVHAVKTNGPSELIYDPGHHILKCGARLVLQTDEQHIEVIR